MKSILTFMVLLFSCLIAISNNSDNGQQKQKEPVKCNTGISNDSLNSKGDTISNYSININGKSNSVQITSDKPFTVSQDTLTKGKNINSIEMKGESNSVNISQSGKGGKVEIRQNGKNNQINISQTYQDTEK